MLNLKPYTLSLTETVELQDADYFLFMERRVFGKPVLFLSSYFKRHQQIYYEKLEDYHDGMVNEWIDFFLDGVIEIANEAIDIVGKITVLREKDMAKIQTLGKRASESAVKVMPKLYVLQS